MAQLLLRIPVTSFPRKYALEAADLNEMRCMSVVVIENTSCNAQLEKIDRHELKYVVKKSFER